MLAALMIGHRFSISAFCNAPSTPGVCWSQRVHLISQVGELLNDAGSANVLTTAA